MNRIRRLLGGSAEEVNTARGFVSALLAILVLAGTITRIAVASDPAPPGFDDEKYLGRQSAEQTLDELSVRSALENQATKLPLGEGLIGHWEFDGNTRDSSGGGHHGSKWSRFAANRFGDAYQAFEGDGKSGRVNITDHKRLDTHDEFTLSAWINPREHVGHLSKSSFIVSKWYSASEPRRPGDNGEYIFGFTPKGWLRLSVGSYDPGTNLEQSWDQVEGETVIPLNRWTHVAATYRNGQIDLFVNGRRDASRQSHITSLTKREYDHDDVRIGGHWNDAYRFNGAIDDVRIHNRALSIDEIVTLHKEIPRRFVFYDPSRGTQPTEQGFRLLDNARGHANPQVTGGVLKQGPTTTQGYQRWYTAPIPIDFSPEGKGTAVEWTAQVKRSGLYVDKSRKREWTGWGVQLQDKNGHTFDIYLGEDRVLLNRDDGNMPIATYKLDTTNRFHHYRFVIDDSQGMLFIDGSSEAAVVGKVGSPNQSRYSKPNEVAFGDCTTNALSEVHVKNFWFANDAQAKSPFYPRRQATDKSLLLHYTFDIPRKDGVEPDESDHGNKAKIHGAAWHKQGMIGGAMKFDGKDDFLDCGNDKSLNFGADDFTVALWFKTDLKHELPYSYNPFINKGAAGSLRPVRPGYGVYATIEHGKAILRWDFGQRSHAARARVISDAWEANCWNHVTMVRRDGAIEAFLNGQRVTQDVQKAMSDASVSGSEHLWIGKIVDNRGGLHLYRGLLDDVRIYNCALSEREIKSLVAMGDVKAVSHAAATTPADGLQQPTCADDVEAFHLAVAKGEVTTVERMLSRNSALANHRNQDKFTPLFQAALPGHTEIAKLLLQSGAKVDDRVLGETPLFRACHDGHTETAGLLLDHGADIDVACNDETPLYIAIDRLHASTVRLLLDRGADPNWIHIHPDAPRGSKDKRSVPLLEALAQVRWATQHLARKKTESDKDRVAYYEKTKKTAEAIAMMFLTHRDINVNAKHPAGGGAALHLVAEVGHMGFAKLLIELGSDVNGRSDRLVRNPIVLPPYNQTPLHLAFAKRHDDLVNLLLENGADPKAKDSRGKIPAEYSESNRAN